MSQDFYSFAHTSSSSSSSSSSSTSSLFSTSSTPSSSSSSSLGFSNTPPSSSSSSSSSTKTPPSSPSSRKGPSSPSANSPGKLVSRDKRKADRSDLVNQKRSKLEVSSSEVDFVDSIHGTSGLSLEADHLARSRWPRAPLPASFGPSSDIIFQQMDIEYVIVPTVVPNMPGNTVGPVAMIRMFGVTEDGHSVLVRVHGFAPYFFVQAPPGFTPSLCEIFRARLDEAVRPHMSSVQNRTSTVIQAVRMVKKMSIVGYHESLSDFLEITTTLPPQVPAVRTMLQGGFDCPSIGHRSYASFESDIPYVLRFMIDRNIMGASWIKIPGGKWFVHGKRISTCQIEVDVAYDQLISLGSEGEWGKIAPLRILSFDIECAARRGTFPDPEKDSVIQIANVVKEHGDSKSFVRNVFTLGSCSSVAGAHILQFQSEADLLLAWRNFVLTCDPDIIIGYNIANFDLPYLLDRARTLKVNDFPLFGRLEGVASRKKDTKFSSAAYGTRESVETTADGRVFLDILQVMQRDHKLRSYSLNAVADEFLDEQKEEVHHSIITELFSGTADDRRRLAVYCLKDANLPLRLMDKLMISYNYIEMARVTGVPLSFLLSRGQQIKVVSQLYRKARASDMLIPFYKQEAGAGEDVAYEGATVIEPDRGFYEDPIATLDFASLYPSIMMSHNLCYSTLLTPQQAKAMDPNDFERTPNGDAFLKSTKRVGLLPQILIELLAARKKAKADLKMETDPSRKAVLDGRQLALKISANSVYGFTGAMVGKLPCLEISAGTTSYGRQMIEMTKTLVEEKYTIANGYAHDAKVIYGDTDSVMVKFGTKDLGEAMSQGLAAAEYVTGHFRKPIKLEFEKCYYPFLLINKKRYAGLLWTKTSIWDKLDTKGIETVRRDNCLLVKNIVTDCLKKILIDRDVDGAKKLVCDTIADLLQNKLDLSLLVISKAMSKDASEYDSKQAHTELAERMRKRDPSTAPAVGDRVPYVIVRAGKTAKAYDKAEDPMYVLENDIPLDYQYYLENQLKNPLIRIFEPILGEAGANSLLTGAHTQKIALPTPKRGGIVGFAIKRESCLGCKATLESAETAVCKSCQPKYAEIYLSQLDVVNRLEEQFTRAWTQCQHCQGSFHQTVLCTSRDCPIFYSRHKVQKDLREAETTLQKFDVSW